jgi:hypothetical protein
MNKEQKICMYLNWLAVWSANWNTLPNPNLQEVSASKKVRVLSTPHTGIA